MNQYPQSSRNKHLIELWNHNAVFIGARTGGTLSKKWMKIEKQSHQKRLQNMKPRVKCGLSPERNPSLPHSLPKNSSVNILTNREVLMENEALVNKIKKIADKGADVKAIIDQAESQVFPMKIEKSLSKTKRFNMLSQINEYNKKFMHTLNTKKSCYSTKVWNDDWEKKKKLISNICLSGKPHILSKNEFKTDLSKTRFKTDEQEKWIQMNSTNTFYNEKIIMYQILILIILDLFSQLLEDFQIVRLTSLLQRRVQEFYLIVQKNQV